MAHSVVHVDHTVRHSYQGIKHNTQDYSVHITRAEMPLTLHTCFLRIQ